MGYGKCRRCQYLPQSRGVHEHRFKLFDCLGDVWVGGFVPGHLSPTVVVDVPLDVRVHDDQVQLLGHVGHAVVGLVQIFLLQRIENTITPW